MNTLFSDLWNCCICTVGRLPFPAAAPIPARTPVHHAPAAPRCALLALFLGLPLAAPGQTMPQENWYAAGYWDLTKAPFNAGGDQSGATQFDDRGNLVIALSGATNRFIKINQEGELVSSAPFFLNSLGFMSGPFAVYSVSNRYYFTQGKTSGSNRTRSLTVSDETGAWLNTVSFSAGPSGAMDLKPLSGGRVALFDGYLGSVLIYDHDLILLNTISGDPDIIGSTMGTILQGAVDPLGRIHINSGYWPGGCCWDKKYSIYREPSVRVAYWSESTAGGPGVLIGITKDMKQIFWDGSAIVMRNGSYINRVTVPVLVPGSSASATIKAAALSPDDRIYVVIQGAGYHGVQIFNRTYRTMWAGEHSSPPVPAVTNIVQRYGTSLLDIDYTVFDADSATGTVAAVAFKDGVQSLDNLVEMHSFVEGTASKLGAGKAFTNTGTRLTWDAAADFSTNFVNLAVTVLAKDDRDLLGLHFLTIPASGVDPELTINRSPVTQAELMPLWYWMTARDDLTGAVFSNSAVYATSWLPPANVTNGIAGVSASYYNDVLWTGAPVTRIESQINYPTGTAWVPAGIDNTTFTVSWRAKFVAQATETLTFHTSTDDGAMLYIDGAAIISKWSSQGMAESSGSINVTAGRTYDLQMDYYQNTSAYGAILRWSSPSIPKQIVPANRLFQSAPPLTPPYLLAAGTHTTAAGRAYLWERLGVREATPAEILRAKEAGHPGTINRYDPRVKVGSHPEKVNEYGFDTGTSWPADSYFVVPLAP